MANAANAQIRKFATFELLNFICKVPLNAKTEGVFPIVERKKSGPLRRCLILVLNYPKLLNKIRQDLQALFNTSRKQFATISRKNKQKTPLILRRSTVVYTRFGSSA